jgi:hypothetical protein
MKEEEMELEKLRYLYRGVSEEMHNAKSSLAPKGTSFFRTIKYGQGFKYDSGVTYGASVNNAIVGHQLDSAKFPTSGISTTPFIDRARIYALSNGKNAKGIIYKIDRALLSKNKVKEYKVSEYAKSPSIPEDDEVILVVENNGALPHEVIVDIVSVNTGD